MAIQEFLNVSKPRSLNLSELQRFALDVDDKLRRISERFSMLEGQQGRIAEHHGPISMQGNKVTGLPRAREMSDAVSLADLYDLTLVRSPTGVFRSPSPISAPTNPTDPSSLVTIGDLQEALAEVVVDRLTTKDASPSTLILSDDDTNQTLTGSLGDMYFKQSTGAFHFGDSSGAAYDTTIWHGQDPLSFAPFYGPMVSNNGSPPLVFNGQVDLGGTRASLFMQLDGSGAISTLIADQAFSDATGLPRLKVTPDDMQDFLTVYGDGDVRMGKHVSVGADANPASDTILSIMETATANTTPTYAIQGLLTADSTLGAWSAINQGLLFGLITEGANNFSGNQTGAKFYLSHQSSGEATGTFTGGEFIAGASGASTGDMGAVNAGQFSPDIPASYAGIIGGFNHIFLTSPALLGGTFTEYTGVHIADLNPNAQTITDLRGIWIESSGAASGLTFGIDCEWSSRMTDSVRWYFGTGKDIGLYHDGNAGRLVIEDGIGNTDIEMYFKGTSNQGSIMWMEDENYFKFNNSVMFNSNVGFYGTTPVSQRSAFTQTYSTATRTHSNLTSSDVTLTPTSGGYGYLDAAEAESVETAINAIRDDLENVKQVLNSLIDDEQALGICA